MSSTDLVNLSLTDLISIDPKLDFISRLPPEILVEALGLACDHVPSDNDDRARDQRARNARNRSIALVCQRWGTVIPPPHDYVIDACTIARNLLTLLEGDEGRRRVAVNVDVDLTKERTVEYLSVVARILAALPNLASVRLYERGASSDPPRLEDVLIDSLVKLNKVQEFVLKLSSGTGSITSFDIIRLQTNLIHLTSRILKTWTNLRTLELGGLTILPDSIIPTCPNIDSLTFPAITESTGIFVQSLIEHCPTLSRLDLSFYRSNISYTPSFSLPTTLTSLTIRDVFPHNTSLSSLIQTAPLPALTKLRLNMNCVDFTFLHALPALRKLAVFVYQINTLDDLDTRLPSLNIDTFVLYGLRAHEFAGRHRIEKTCIRLDISFVTARYWTTYSHKW